MSKLIVALVAVLSLTACSNLKETLGLGTDQQSDVFNGIGMVVVQANGAFRPANPDEVAALLSIVNTVDNAGDQGSESDASQEGTAATTTEVDAGEVLSKAIDAAVATYTGPAGVAAAEAKDLFDAGDTAGAEAKLEEAKGLEGAVGE